MDAAEEGSVRPAIAPLPFTPGALSRRVRRVLRAGAAMWGLVSCNAPPPTVYCVYESDALSGGRCLTECESRCNLEAIAGCAAATCVADCEAERASTPAACLDAGYTYWRCLRVSGQPRVTCAGGKPSFSVPEGTCLDEQDLMRKHCPLLEGGVRDAASD